jgi:hypothetical protein
MSYTTIGAILTGVGALCQMVASGFSQQIEVLQVFFIFTWLILNILKRVNFNITV